MNISTKLKTKRKELNLTQQEVADKVFVTRQTISKWELGKSQPDLISLKLLDNLLQLSDFKETNSKGVFKMNQRLTLKDLIFTLLFGILFLPIRFLYRFSQQHNNSKTLKYFIKPSLILLFLLYIRSLNLKAFISVLMFSFILYYLIKFYYSERNTV